MCEMTSMKSMKKHVAELECGGHEDTQKVGVDDCKELDKESAKADSDHPPTSDIIPINGNEKATADQLAPPPDDSYGFMSHFFGSAEAAMKVLGIKDDGKGRKIESTTGDSGHSPSMIVDEPLKDEETFRSFHNWLCQVVLTENNGGMPKTTIFNILMANAAKPVVWGETQYFGSTVLMHVVYHFPSSVRRFLPHFRRGNLSADQIVNVMNVKAECCGGDHYTALMLSAHHKPRAFKALVVFMFGSSQKEKYKKICGIRNSDQKTALMLLIEKNTSVAVDDFLFSLPPYVIQPLIDGFCSNKYYSCECDQKESLDDRLRRLKEEKYKLIRDIKKHIIDYAYSRLFPRVDDGGNIEVFHQELPRLRRLVDHWSFIVDYHVPIFGPGSLFKTNTRGTLEWYFERVEQQESARKSSSQ